MSLSSHITEKPSHITAEPSPITVEPFHVPLEPSHVIVEPSHVNVEPSHVNADPSHVNAEPPLVTLEPSLVTLKPSHITVEPFHGTIECSYITVEPLREPECFSAKEECISDPYCFWQDGEPCGACACGKGGDSRKSQQNVPNHYALYFEWGSVLPHQPPHSQVTCLHSVSCIP